MLSKICQKIWTVARVSAIYVKNDIYKIFIYNIYNIYKVFLTKYYLFHLTFNFILDAKILDFKII